MNRRGRAATVVAWLVRIVVVAAVLAVATLSPFASGGDTTETARIVTYDAAMTLSRDGDLSTDETLRVDLPAGKRGIFRIFDTADPRRDGVDHPVEVVSVERDDATEPWTEVDGASGTTSIRIGEESTFLSAGEHQYRIRSTTTDVFEPGEDGETWFWWDVVGSGWQMPMGSAAVTVALPATPLRAECVMGEDTPCDAVVEGTTLTVSTGALDPFTPVTVRVAFDEDDVATPIEGDSMTLTVVASILAALLAASLALVLVRATREREPGFPVLFEPPFRVPPALGVKVLDEKDSSADLQATLFDLSERGTLRLQGDDDTWYVTVVEDPASVDLHPVEQALLDALGLDSVGDSFVVSDSVSSGETVAEARTALRSQVGASAATYLSGSAAGIVGVLIGWASLLGLGVMVGVYFASDTGWVSWPLLCGAAAFVLVAAGIMFDHGVATTRTSDGRDLWSRTGGFARFLTTDSSESRFDAAAHMDWYPRYLAWAVALGSADEWARRYEAQGVSVPVVPWLIWTGTGQHFSTDRMSQSFDSAIASASAAYVASQAASSGGGGFSGGSGGGGGGGGSW